MSFEAEIHSLASADNDVRLAASQALSASGAAAVAPLMEHLCDEGSPIEWSTTAWVLRRIGDPAVRPLIDVIASDASAEVRRRAGWTLNGLKISGPVVLAPAFAHADPRVRANAAVVVQYLAAEGVAYADLLLELLGDRDEDVRQRAVWALAAIGEPVTAALRSIRRAPSTGRRRRATALRALAEIGGRDALDARDRVALDRLIAVKRLDEVPEPMHLCGSWYAVPAGDEDEVFAAFGLTDPVPVTMRLGASAWNRDHHSFAHATPHAKHRRVYVSPLLDGWRMVFGCASDDLHPDGGTGCADGLDHDLVKARCAALSLRFGAARWYGMSCGDSWTGWCIAERGEVVRYYDAYAAEQEDEDDPEPTEPVLVGVGHASEEGFALPHEDLFPLEAFADVDRSDPDAFSRRYTQVKNDLNIPDTCDGAIVAGRTSVDPSDLGPQTRKEGSGWLAMTECGRVYGDAPGALSV